MRFSTSSIFVTLLAVREAAAASCSSSNVEGNPYLVDYDIWADNVYDIPGFCGGLWDNLKGRGCEPSATYCGGLESSRILNWRFRSGILCLGGNVEGAWWEATKNEFGSIDCP